MTTNLRRSPECGVARERAVQGAILHWADRLRISSLVLSPRVEQSWGQLAVWKRQLAGWAKRRDKWKDCSSQRRADSWGEYAYPLLLLFSCWLVSDSMQHTRLPCPSPSPRDCSNSYPLSQWCHPTISSSVAPFFPCPQSFSELGSFPVSWLFISGGQIVGASASASALPMNIQGWFPLGFTDLRSLLSRGLSRVFFITTIEKHQFFNAQPSLWSYSYICTNHILLLTSVTTGKTITLTRWTFVGRVMSLLFNTVSRFVIAFFPKCKCLFISWLQSPSTVILELKKIKSDTVYTFSHLFAMKWWTGCHDLSFFFFWMPSPGGL